MGLAIHTDRANEIMRMQAITFALNNQKVEVEGIAEIEAEWQEHCKFLYGQTLTKNISNMQERIEQMHVFWNANLKKHLGDFSLKAELF